MRLLENHSLPFSPPTLRSTSSPKLTPCQDLIPFNWTCGTSGLWITSSHRSTFPKRSSRDRFTAPFQVFSAFGGPLMFSNVFPYPSSSREGLSRSSRAHEQRLSTTFPLHARFGRTLGGLKPFGSVPDRSRTLPLFTELTLPLKSSFVRLSLFSFLEKKGEVQRHSDVH